MFVRANEHAAGGDDLDLFHAFKPVFETLAMAKVSTCAEDARGLGFLRPADLISMNRDRQVADAKATALALVRAGWRPQAIPPTEPSIRVLGEELIAGAKLAIHMMLRGEYISEYDAHVARKLAHVLAGGALSSGATRQRTISARPRTRSLRKPLRRTQNPGAHRPHLENRQAPQKLI